MINKLLSCYIGRGKLDDRDHYGNKRVELAGTLLAQLFRTSFSKLVKDIRINLQREINQEGYGKIMNIKDNISKIIKASTIDNTMKYSLATGNWGMKTMNMRVLDVKHVKLPVLMEQLKSLVIEY